MNIEIIGKRKNINLIKPTQIHKLYLHEIVGFRHEASWRSAKKS